MRSIWLITFLVLPLASQEPTIGSKAFFLQNPRVVLEKCATEAQRLEKDKDHAETLAEIGRGYLASGDRPKANDLFDRAGVASRRGFLLSPTSILFLRNQSKIPDLDTSGLTVPSGGIQQLIGCSWLRTGHVPEALAVFESLVLLNPGDEDALINAAKDLMRGGLDSDAETLMEKGWSRKPLNWEACLDFAQTAALSGRSGIASKWCQKALEAAPKEATAWSRAARILADTVGVNRGNHAPWARPFPTKIIGPSRNIWVIESFELNLSDSKGFFNSARQSFDQTFPDRARFTQNCLARIHEVLKDAKPLPDVHTINEIPSKQNHLASQLGERDVILGIDLFEVKDDQISQSTSTMHFRQARLRLAMYDRAGILLSSTTFQTSMPRITKLENGVNAAIAQMLHFLSSPTFARWLE